MTVVKVQRPLSPPDAPWLIYDNKMRHVEHRHPSLIPHHVHKVMASSPKAYFSADWSSDNHQWILRAEAKPRLW
jgi:hypothetical protein